MIKRKERNTLGMKRKLLSLLLALSMAFALAACGGGDTETPPPSSSPSETPSESPSETPSESPSEEPSESETPANTPAPAPALSGTMKVVATSEDYVTLFDAFTQETGVKVELLSMSSGEVLSKLRAEGGTPSADLWFGGGIDAFMSAKEDGLLEQVTFAAAADLADEFKDPDGFWFSKGITIVGFLLNDALMDELQLTAPASWADLTNASYAGEIIMSNPAVSGTNYAVVNALLQTLGEEEGWNYFDSLNANIAYYGKRGSDPLNKTGAGEYAIGISYIDRGVEAQAEEKGLTIVYPSDGIPWVPEGVAVFKNADNVDAAKYFVEWLFSSDDNLRMLAEIDKKDGVKLVKPSLEGVTLRYDTGILMKEDLSLFGTQRTEILERFETLMGDKAADE